MASRAGLPLRDVIAAAIRGRIIDGSYVPGSRLREEEIASDFDVSRVPVREAFQVLEQQQLHVLNYIYPSEQNLKIL